MSRHARLLLSLIFLLLLVANKHRGLNAEWVDIPEFSDSANVYRRPITQRHDQGGRRWQQYHHHQLKNNQERIYYATTATSSTAANYYGKGARVQIEMDLKNTSGIYGNYGRPFVSAASASLVNSNSYETGAETEAVREFESEAVPKIETVVVTDLETGIKTEVESEVETEVETEYSGSDEAEFSDEQENATQFSETSIEDDLNKPNLSNFKSTKATSTSSSTETSRSQENFGNTENNERIFDYLPIDLLKRVHNTLKSQPPTLKGKIRYLKVMEKSLMKEIESRLSAVLTPSRMPRSARSHDEHDEIGFPSLEGTLMAISFLTFAVYLVRLVLMLFRNTGSTPIIIGRKRRSVNDLNEETARILSYINPSLK